MKRIARKVLLPSVLLFSALSVFAAGPRKGGTLRMNGFTPPKSMNAFVDNSHYAHMTFSFSYETLLDIDPETTEFTPLLASEWEVSEDAQTFTFRIDPEAKWSDGKPVTAADVKWTFDAVMAPDAQTGPNKAVLKDFDSPEIIDEKTVRFRVHHGEKHWRDLLSCGGMEIMPKHVFEGKNFNALSLENAVVSGPYILTKVDEQVEAVFTRRRDWWRSKRDPNRWNFDTIRIRYFADDTNALESFKSGELDVYAVYNSRIWMHDASGPKFDRNQILKRPVKNHRPVGFQGFSMNMRKPPFDDLRVRQAMALLLDRETLNRTLCYGQYFLMRSYCEDLYDAEHPCPNKLWGYDPAAAKKLLEESGWSIDPKTKVLTKNGQRFEFTFLSRGSGEDKFLAPFSAELKKLGIVMHIERNDFATWMRNMDAFNFTMTWACWGADIFRDAEPMWHSNEADRNSGSNIVGFRDKEVDRLIEAEKGEFSASKRAESQRRIDALITEQVPYVLLWNTDTTRILHWNRFGMPAEPLGKYGDETKIPSLWWVDEDKSEELEESLASGSYLPSITQR